MKYKQKIEEALYTFYVLGVPGGMTHWAYQVDRAAAIMEHRQLQPTPKSELIRPLLVDSAKAAAYVGVYFGIRALM
jgi:hypothetical protein